MITRESGEKNGISDPILVHVRLLNAHMGTWVVRTQKFGAHTYISTAAMLYVSSHVSKMDRICKSKLMQQTSMRMERIQGFARSSSRKRE